jgi:chemotaxis protein methyltransferase CheR
MSIGLFAPELSAAEFHHIRSLVHRVSGIDLHPGKEGLVKSRLTKRLRALGIDTFEDYLAHLERDASGGELAMMVDVLTTNKTSFFREPKHFDYLRDHVLPTLRSRGGAIRLWSAACSTGEEPFSIAMVLSDELGPQSASAARILASDISARVLAHAAASMYEEEVLRDVPHPLIGRHFTLARTSPTRAYRVNDALRSMVRFARLNLIGPWPMRGPFDVIFCRNVMIYFDQPTQQRLVHRFWEILAPGGHLFVGHSESLNAFTHQFRYVQPAVYVK